jgi:hypothetical protein
MIAMPEVVELLDVMPEMVEVLDVMIEEACPWL